MARQASNRIASAPPATWAALERNPAFLSELRGIGNAAQLQQYVHKLGQTDPGKLRLIQANHTEFAALLNRVTQPSSAAGTSAAPAAPAPAAPAAAAIPPKPPRQVSARTQQRAAQAAKLVQSVETLSSSPSALDACLAQLRGALDGDAACEAFALDGPFGVAVRGCTGWLGLLHAVGYKRIGVPAVDSAVERAPSARHGRMVLQDRESRRPALTQACEQLAAAQRTDMYLQARAAPPAAAAFPPLGRRHSSLVRQRMRACELPEAPAPLAPPSSALPAASDSLARVLLDPTNAGSIARAGGAHGLLHDPNEGTWRVGAGGSGEPRLMRKV